LTVLNKIGFIHFTVEKEGKIYYLKNKSYGTYESLKELFTQSKLLRGISPFTRDMLSSIPEKEQPQYQKIPSKFLKSEDDGVSKTMQNYLDNQYVNVPKEDTSPNNKKPNDSRYSGIPTTVENSKRNSGTNKRDEPQPTEKFDKLPDNLVAVKIQKDEDEIQKNEVVSENQYGFISEELAKEEETKQAYDNFPTTKKLDNELQYGVQQNVEVVYDNQYGGIPMEPKKEEKPIYENYQ